jgi:hypothetical protein
VKSRIQTTSIAIVVSPLKKSRARVRLSPSLVEFSTGILGATLLLALLLIKVMDTATSATKKFSNAPVFNVGWKPQFSISKRGMEAPAIAPTTLDRYRKLNDRCAPERSSDRIANIAHGMVAPIKAHHGNREMAITTPEAT